MHQAWKVKEEIEVALGRGSEGEPYMYPIYPDDELHKNEDGTFTKVAPGLCIHGFEIRDELVEEYTETRRWVI